MPIRDAFDESYYQLFYLDPNTRAISPVDFDKLGDFVCSYLLYLDQSVSSVLDVGCGLGAWRNVIKRHFPAANYTGVEVSDYVCQRFGWHKASVVDFTRAPGST